MSRAVVLGGGGAIGSVAVHALVVAGKFDEVIVADVRAEEAESVARSAPAGDGCEIAAAAVDATSAASIGEAVAGASVVVNCVGPYYRFGAPVLSAVIEAGVDYVDVCDDLDATRAQLELEGAARDGGVCAVIGMGNSPGLANLLARFAADELLDRVEAVDIMHVHGGEPTEGPAVVKHRIHAMVDDVPLFVDGEVREVRLLDASGQAWSETIDFDAVGRVPVYPYPHPETITLPAHIEGVRRATNRGVVLPLAYFQHTMDVVRRGLVGDPCPDESTIDGWVEEILAARPRFLAESGLDGPRGCLAVAVRGRLEGEQHEFTFRVSSEGSGAGEGTGIPAAIGAAMVHDAGIRRPGVHPPEAIIPPLELFRRTLAVLDHLGPGGGEGEVPVRIEHVLPDGSVDHLPLPV